MKKPEKKKGGPYGLVERHSRRAQVHKLHFEYGYSAVEISKILKKHRNTISDDIHYWNSKILKNLNMFQPENIIILLVERYETQRTRLREQLDQTIDSKEKIALQRLIFDINSKIILTYRKLAESTHRIHKLGTEWLNDHLKERNEKVRYLTFYDTISVSEEAKERITQIIDEDRKKKPIKIKLIKSA